MVKRPLVLLAAAYLLGICTGKGRGIPSCLLPVLLFVSFFLMVYKKAYRRDKILFLAPVFLAAGFCRAGQAAAPRALERFLTDEVECRLYGVVAEASVGTYGGKMRIERTELYLAQGECCIGGGDMVVSIPNSLLAEPGSKVLLSGKARPLSEGDNPGQFNEYGYYKAQGICAKMQAENIEVLGMEGKLVARLLWKGKQKLQQVFAMVLPQQEAGILAAMLLAEKGMLMEETKDLYRNSGISHILAVSGLHLSLIGLGIYKALRKARAGAKVSMAAATGFILLYGCFTGFGISVARAAIMLLLSILSAGFGKTYDAPTGLAAAALAVLLPQPLQLFQAGFLMSFGAVAGILLFSPIFQKMGLRFLSGSLAVQLALLPVLLWFYYGIPTYSIALNLVILPFMGLLLVLAVLVGATGCIYIGAGRFLAGGAYVLLKCYGALCGLNEKLPGSWYCFGRPAVWQVCLYYLLLFLFYLFCRKFQKKRCLWLLLALSIFPCLRYSNQLSVTYLAVGQGDCAVIQRGRTTILMDAGSSYQNGADRILTPYLQYGGDTRIEYAVLSHADSDHYSMMKEILEDMAAGDASVRIDTLILAAAGASQENSIMLQELAGRAGVECMFFSAGDCIRFGDMVLSCLYPGRELGEIGDTNKSSLVMLLETSASAFVFTGDIGGEEEKLAAGALMERGKSLEGKGLYLKAAHHGSKYSSTGEFLQYLKNGTAVISCGKGNRYGHPHEETLERLAGAGIAYFITWQSGAVRIRDGMGEAAIWHGDWE